MYSQKFRSIVKPGSLVANYKILITELMKPKTLSDFIKELINSSPAKFKESIDSVLFQLFYTLKFFNSIGFVHNDLHLGNIMIEDLGDKTTEFYYVVDEHIVPLKTKYFVRVYDFDRSYLNKDGPFGVEKRTEHQKFEFEEVYKDDYTPYTNSVLDYFYVMRWIEHDMLQLNINLSKDDSNKRTNVNYLYKIIIDTLRFDVHGYFEYFNMIDTDAIQGEQYLIKTPNDPENSDNIDILYQKTPTEWLNIMNQYMIKIKGDTVKEILITPSSEIFFIANKDGTPPKLLVDAINSNDSWNKLDQNQKLIVCSPLLSIQSGGNRYLHKYLKYKAKYLQAKQRHY